jgi:hypothetical protein
VSGRLQVGLQERIGFGQGERLKMRVDALKCIPRSESEAGIVAE